MEIVSSFFESVYFIVDSNLKNGMCAQNLDWLQSLKHVFINVPYHILVASLVATRVRLSSSI